MLIVAPTVISLPARFILGGGDTSSSVNSDVKRAELRAQHKEELITIFHRGAGFCDVCGRGKESSP